MTTPATETKNRRGNGRVISILSLVGGVIGVVISPAGFGILLPIVAVVLGLVGRSRERAGKRFWLTGLLLGIVGIVISVISLFYQYLIFKAIAGFTTG